MAMKDKFMAFMTGHIGAGNGIKGTDLARAMALSERDLRHLIDEVINDGIAVCGLPSTGYFIASNFSELEKTCRFHDNRAMHELTKSAKLRSTSLADLVGQQRLES